MNPELEAVLKAAREVMRQAHLVPGTPGPVLGAIGLLGKACYDYQEAQDGPARKS